MIKNPNVLFVAAEIAPLAKVGGLADVVGALPKALEAIGTKTAVALPYYDFLRSNKQIKAKKLFTLDVLFDSKIEQAAIFQGVLPGTGITLYLYDRPGLKAAEIYGSAKMSGGLYVNPLADLERFIFFSVAVALSMDRLPVKFSVVHCHDWHTALIPYLLRNSAIKTLYTIHNLANQGLIDDLLVRWLGAQAPGLPKTHDQYNLMAAGIEYAQYVNTVSPAYAEEIKTREFGCKLESVIRKQAAKLSGIINGIDTEIFDPETDRHIKQNYNCANLSLKTANKLYLQKTLGLPVDAKIPIIGLVSRFVTQKGLDLITEKVINLPAQFVLLGEGDLAIENNLLTLANRHDNLSVVKGFDLKLAQQIYAGADFFLMPSRFEPCGLGQLIALRYGTLPIVSAVGGLKDTVTAKNGYRFMKKTPKALLVAINQALTEFYAQPRLLKAKKIRAMKGDYSWQKSAKKYQKIYINLANIK